MNIIQLTESNVAEVIATANATLADGGLVIYPTETCYGIGVDATNQKAVDTLLQYKSKRKDKPLSVAVTGEEMAAQYVEINDTARNIYTNLLPGPITVVSRSLGKLADGVESSMGTQGIRVSSHPFVAQWVANYGLPITSTSANASYKKTPYAIDDILNNISDKQKALVSLIINAGELPRRKPSTVIDTTLDNIYIMRQGGLEIDGNRAFLSYSLEDTEKFVNEVFEEIADAVGTRTIVFLLQGDLGAGKTHTTKYIAEKIGVTDVVTSPTYTICKQYNAEYNRAPMLLQHMDTYRLFEPEEIDDLRPEEIFAAPNVVVIEWANKVAEYIQKYTTDAVIIKVNYVVLNETTRRFEFEIQQ